MTRARNGFLLIGLLGFVLAANQGFAADQGITGKKLLLKSKPKMVLLSRDGLVVAGSDPRCVAAGGSGLGGSVTLHDSNNNTVTLDMPCENWSANSKGTLYKYKNKTGAPKVAKLKGGLLKVVSPGMGGFPVPDPYGFVEADVTVGSDKYCMFFQGPGDGNKFLSKDQLAGSCGVCGDGVQDELEDCDGSDAEWCPGLCQGDCTCPTPVCGNGIIEFLGGEECDGGNDDLCPGGCDEECHCDFSTPVCCDGLSDDFGIFFNGCGNAVPLDTCLSEGTVEEPAGVCDASATCVASSPVPAGCCAADGQCFMPVTAGVCTGILGGVFTTHAICSPSGTCESQCDATTGGLCWFYGATNESCSTVCANNGLTYDEATRTYAGSAGSDANCASVLDDLGAPAGPINAIDCSSLSLAGTGCGNTTFPQRFRCTDSTTSSASAFDFRRACACKE